MQLPSALDHLDDMIQLAGTRRMVIFLDYDGTLTPIVTRPEDAHLSDRMRAVLTDLARSSTVAIVSGRDLADVRERVHLERLYYAGSHGFEIAGPDGLSEVYGPAQTFLAALEQAEGMLRDQLAGIAGSQVERKQFAIAVHFRRVSEDDIDQVVAIVNAVHEAHPALRKIGGKKVFDLRPNLNWHKGTALFWLLDVMGLDREAVLPVYIGDDVTDEDAFVALQDIGIGIIVRDGSCRPTAARYALASTEAVHAFLVALITTYERSSIR
jgi:trehalose 6-phosphate phosphatase